MALFEGAKKATNKWGPYDQRSNTRLVVSGGDSPAEKWIAKKDLPTLFAYPFGDSGQTDIIIAKGMMVGLTGKTIKDYDTNRFIPELSIASTSIPGIGMVPYNLSRQVDDRFTGNQPSIITREYVELPYIPALSPAGDCKWGLVHGANLKAGDYLKVSSDLPGKLTKWVSGTDSPILVMAQILGINDTGAPNAWMEWAMFDESAKNEDDAYINKSGASAPGENGYPFDPEYRDGTIDMPPYLNQYITKQTGLPGLTDGAAMRSTVFTGKEIGTIPTGATLGTKYVFQAPQKQLISGTVKIYYGGSTDISDDCVFDYKNGYITLTIDAALVTAAAAVNLNITMDYRAMQYGTPTYWDFSGSVGAVRLLLKL